MSEQLSWNRDGERLALRGELDQEFILSAVECTRAGDRRRIHYRP